MNDKVFRILELEYYPAVEHEESCIATRKSKERFKVNDIFVAGREMNNWKRCLVNIVVSDKENDKCLRIENLLIRSIEYNDSGLTKKLAGPATVYKHIFGEKIVPQDNNGQIKIIKEPDSNIQINPAPRKRNNKSVGEPFEYNYSIDHDHKR
ncbi:MAG: hypothetical protein LBN34_07705 [Clostridiales Family XIII bacterium]|nr:hypothetical protein [Clostridiales Family XIII bacterium]